MQFLEVIYVYAHPLQDNTPRFFCGVVKQPDAFESKVENLPQASFVLVDSQGSAMTVNCFVAFTGHENNLFAGMVFIQKYPSSTSYHLYIIGVLSRYQPEDGADATLTLREQAPYSVITNWEANPEYSHLLNVMSLDISETANLSHTSRLIADGQEKLASGGKVCVSFHVTYTLSDNMLLILGAVGEKYHSQSE
jgi:hypothetical protein